MYRTSRSALVSTLASVIEHVVVETFAAFKRAILTVMRSSRPIAIGAAAITLAHVSQTDGAILLQDNFDSYANQTAFQTFWAPATTTATLDTTLAFSGTQSVQAGTAAQRNSRGFTGTTPTSSTAVEFSFRFYDSDATAAAYREYAEIDSGAATSSGQLFALGMNNNIVSSNYMARVLGADGGTGSGAFFKLDGTGTPNAGNAALTRTTGWHELKVDIKGASADFYVDGLLARTGITGYTVRSMDTIKVGSNLTAGKSANFDDVLVQTVAVPEPATLGLLGLTALLGLRRRVR
jgi:PEP-CTERM motif-containing protein